MEKWNVGSDSLIAGRCQRCVSKIGHKGPVRQSTLTKHVFRECQGKAHVFREGQGSFYSFGKAYHHLRAFIQLPWQISTDGLKRVIFRFGLGLVCLLWRMFVACLVFTCYPTYLLSNFHLQPSIRSSFKLPWSPWSAFKLIWQGHVWAKLFSHNTGHMRLFLHKERKKKGPEDLLDNPGDTHGNPNHVTLLAFRQDHVTHVFYFLFCFVYVRMGHIAHEWVLWYRDMTW